MEKYMAVTKIVNKTDFKKRTLDCFSYNKSSC